MSILILALLLGNNWVVNREMPEAFLQRQKINSYYKSTGCPHIAVDEDHYTYRQQLILKTLGIGLCPTPRDGLTRCVTRVQANGPYVRARCETKSGKF